jgi:hypothetical protein
MCKMTFVFRIPQGTRRRIAVLAKAWSGGTSSFCTRRIRTSCEAGYLVTVRVPADVVFGTFSDRTWESTWLDTGGWKIAFVAELGKAGLRSRVCECLTVHVLINSGIHIGEMVELRDFGGRGSSFGRPRACHRIAGAGITTAQSPRVHMFSWVLMTLVDG